MQQPIRRLITPQEYLAFEHASSTRHEYSDGVVYPWGDWDHPLDPEVVLGKRAEPKAMAGGTEAHSTIKVNLTIAIGSHLRGGHCRLFDSDLRLRPDDAAYYYPDLWVVCDGRQSSELVTERNDPLLVIEVLSTSTEADDRGEKFDHYANARTLQEYVLISTRRQQAQVFRRIEGGWSMARVTPPQHLHLESINLDLAFTVVYESVSLPIMIETLADT